MILNLGWEEDLKLKLRFLELMFLLVTILIATKPAIGPISRNALLLFLVFGSLYYFILANGIMEDIVIVSTSLIAGFSLATFLSSVFIGLKTLEPSQGIAYLILLGIIFSFGMLPKKALMDTLRKF